MTAPDAPRDVPAEGPATEAGPALWEKYGGTTASKAILAIEQQARQAALDDVRREVKRIDYRGNLPAEIGQVLAILDRLSQRPDGGK